MLQKFSDFLVLDLILYPIIASFGIDFLTAILTFFTILKEFRLLAVPLIYWIPFSLSRPIALLIFSWDLIENSKEFKIAIFYTTFSCLDILIHIFAFISLIRYFYYLKDKANHRMLAKRRQVEREQRLNINSALPVSSTNPTLNRAPALVTLFENDGVAASQSATLFGGSTPGEIPSYSYNNTSSGGTFPRYGLPSYEMSFQRPPIVPTAPIIEEKCKEETIQEADSDPEEYVWSETKSNRWTKHPLTGTCHICFRLYSYNQKPAFRDRQPRLQVCGHVLCRLCVRRLRADGWTRTDDGGKRVFNCPFCRRECGEGDEEASPAKILEADRMRT